MENREKICNYDQLLKAMEVCAEIQNNEIGTVFYEFYGHINRSKIRIHLPKWVNGGDPDYTFELRHDPTDDREENEETLNSLKEVLINGKLPDEVAERNIYNKEKLIRRQQYEQLKKEFEPI